MNGKLKRWEDVCLHLVIMCLLLCHCLCSIFYISFAPGPRKKSNLYVLLLDISPNHSIYRANSSSLHRILTLYSPLSSLIFPLWQENVPCSSALWCQNERLLAGWAKEYLKDKFKCTGSDHIVIADLKNKGKGLSVAWPAVCLLQPLKYYRVENIVDLTGGLLHPFCAMVCGGSMTGSGVLGPHHLQPVCFCGLSVDLKLTNCFNLTAKTVCHGIWVTLVAGSQSSFVPTVLQPWLYPLVDITSSPYLGVVQGDLLAALVKMNQVTSRVQKDFGHFSHGWKWKMGSVVSNLGWKFWRLGFNASSVMAW